MPMKAQTDLEGTKEAHAGLKDTGAPVDDRPPIVAALDLSKPILRLSRDISVREHKVSDYDALSYHGNNLKIARNMRDRFPYPYTEDDAKSYISLCHDAKTSWQPTSVPLAEATDSTPRLPVSWIIAQDDKPIGGCGLKFPGDIHRFTVQVGYWIGEDYWNKGITSELLQAFVPWIWETYPFIVKIEANVYSWNPASGKALLNAGFVEEGRLKNSVFKYDEYCDLLWYGLERPGVNLEK